MKIHITIAAFMLATLPLVRANSDMRDWTFITGSPLRAELTDYNEKTGEISLRKEDKAVLKFQRDELTSVDKAWLLQWVEYKEEMQAMVQKLGGTIDKKTGTGVFTTEYSVYHPSGSTPGALLPLMILFHPGGNGHRDILRYVEAADARAIVMVVEAWVRMAKPGGHLDTKTPPSQAPDRQEMVALILEDHSRCGTCLLPIMRDTFEKFLGFGDNTAPNFTSTAGRFSGLMPKHPQSAQEVTTAMADLHAMGMLVVNRGFDPSMN